MPAGRMLDDFVHERNREVNMKAKLEKIRKQVPNIE